MRAEDTGRQFVGGRPRDVLKGNVRISAGRLMNEYGVERLTFWRALARRAEMAREPIYANPDQSED
ncbi:MAG: hypothetical protein JO166_01720 [Deltaproteobacteria bacterium]|nr:hypothetical protein [Deltaproteobacteria bacterium]